MRTRDLSLWAMPLLLLAVGGCGDKPAAPAKGAATPAADVHAHPEAPHGGELLELGEEEAHLELVHDSKAGSVTVYVLGKDGKTPISVAPPTIVVATKEGPKEITLTAVNPKADGTADTFKGSHASLMVEPLDGRIRVTIAGKAFQSPLEAAPHNH